jgi:hypothetical protein
MSLFKIMNIPKKKCNKLKKEFSCLHMQGILLVKKVNNCQGNESSSTVFIIFGPAYVKTVLTKHELFNKK